MSKVTASSATATARNGFPIGGRMPGAIERPRPLESGAPGARRARALRRSSH
jgi:hypothetical protein